MVKLIRFDCDPEKVTQILNFFALQAGGSINKLKAIKLAYLADRYHLRKFSRLISNDNYVAMKLGPVPSKALDIAECDNFLDEEIKDYSKQFISPEGKYSIKSVGPLDETVFSESDIEALNYSWKNFSHLGKYELAKLTHKYPEWKKHEIEIKANPKSSFPMDLLDFLEDPNAGIDPCFKLDDQDRATRREHLAQMAHLESIWR